MVRRAIKIPKAMLLIVAALYSLAAAGFAELSGFGNELFMPVTLV
jgi:hypothetical protein